MKRLVCVLILFYLSVAHVHVFAQVGNDIPVLIRTLENPKLDRLEIVTPCVDDTTRIAVNVAIRFDRPFGDSVELNAPKEIYVLGFSYLAKDITKKDSSKNSDEIVFDFFEYAEHDLHSRESTISNQETLRDRCIREVCDAQFKIWLEKQPYSQMYDIERFYGHNALTLVFPVILIPERLCKE